MLERDAAALDRIVRQRDPERPGAMASVRRVVGGQLRVHEQQLVERDAELVRDRVQRADRRLGAAGLDLGDEARRHADDLGQPAQAEPARLAHLAQPVAHLGVLGFGRSAAPLAAHASLPRCCCVPSYPGAR